MSEAEVDHAIDYRCNICGAANSRMYRRLHRELPDCVRCGSSPRMRGLIHALGLALFGRSAPLPSWPERPDLRGLGFSDNDVYATPLSWKTSFVNTFLDQEPKLDLLSDDWRSYKRVDFLVCAEVLEHVPAPCERALVTLRRLLEPGGIAVLSTPYTDRKQTKEHFTDLNDFEIVRGEDGLAVLNTRVDGVSEILDGHVHLHGGSGLTLEMRVFAEQDLLRLIADTGFRCVVHDAPAPEIGYLWPRREQRSGDGVSLDHVITAVAV